MKLDRLLGILTVLLQNDCVTAPYLAKRFEVNRRTISRDIDSLCQAGIPIVTRQGVGGGISIAEGFRLDKSVLTRDELSGIIAGLKGIGSVSKQTHIERTLDKLGANTRAISSRQESVVIDLASHYKDQLADKIELIKNAIHETRVIEFDYYYKKGESHRCIEPYFATFQWGGWYVFGFCLKRQDWRMFKLVRLSNLTVCKGHYSQREIPHDHTDFNAYFIENQYLSVIFELSERYKLIEMYGSNCYTETSEGLHLQIGFTNRDYIISWLLGFGDKAKVLEPSDIAEYIQIIAKKILSVYEQT